MKSNQRQALLKIAAGVMTGLWLLNWLVISPALTSWGEQSERITALRTKVQRGQQLTEREASIRGRWAEMVRANLPADRSAAENEALKAISRWQRESGVGQPSWTPQWQTHEEGYNTLEFRMATTGNQASLSRFIYELEVDPIPVSLEECEIATRDAHGAQLTMTARISFVQLTEAKKNKR